MIRQKMLKITQLTFSCLIFFALVFVSVKTIQEPTTQTTEGRNLASFPASITSYDQLQNYFKEMDTWATDRMHYRQELITSLTQLRLYWGASTFNTVTVGKDGWLFLHSNEEDADANGSGQFTADELQRWKKYLLYRNDEVKKHGGIFLFVMLPNKSTIYPEYLPDNFIRLSNNTRLQQVVDVMQGSGVLVIDTRQTLIAAKNAGQLYTKADTHWNMLGANYAQHQIFQVIHKFLPDLDPVLYPYHYANMEERNQLDQSNDLYRMLGLGDRAPVEFEPLLPIVEGVGKCAGTYNPEAIRKNWPLAVGDCSKMTSQANDPAWFAMIKRGWGGLSQDILDFIFKSSIYEPGRHTLLVVHDSYFEMLQPYFSNQFKHAYYVFLGRPLEMWAWTAFLESTHPDIVIEEMLERTLKVGIPRPGIDYPADYQSMTRLNEK